MSETNEHLLNYYHTHQTERGFTEYSVDGIVDYEAWSNVPLKVLYLLKENWGYQGCGVFSMAEEIPKWIADGVPTYKRIAIMSELIFSRMSADFDTTPDQLKDDSERLIKAIKQVAVINIKKVSGTSTSNDAAIRRESRKNAELLRMQIENIKPDVIIAGGSVCWDSLILDVGLFNSGQKTECWDGFADSGIVLFRSKHPSARVAFPFDNIAKSICDLITKKPTSD